MAFWAAACAALLLVVSAPVVADGLNSHPAPAERVIAATSPATSVQVASAQGLGTAPLATTSAKKRQKTKTVLRRVTMNSRITDQPIVTEEGKGTYVGIKCPVGQKAISGGVVSQYINLLVSSSAPNQPLTGKFTPNIWWVTVSNVNVDGQGGSLSWHGVVNCLSPVRLGTS